MKVLMFVSVLISFFWHSNQTQLTEEVIEAEWQQFKKIYHPLATSGRYMADEQFRKNIFAHNLEEILAHNAKYTKGLVSYEKGLNQFSDRSDEEIRPYLNGIQLPTTPESPNFSVELRSGTALPESVDWRTEGAVTPIKDQGACGSCWAFSATGAVESHLLIYRNTFTNLSEQNLVDCVENRNCQGGWMNEAFQYIIQNDGINTGLTYPYEAKDSTCRFRRDDPFYQINDISILPKNDEQALKEAVALKGPVAVAIDSSGPFHHYKNGVFYNPDCEQNKFRHAVLVVGYGSENREDFWLVKNSWGDKWGEQGYIKMARNRNNNCGIAGVASFPVVI